MMRRLIGQQMVIGIEGTTLLKEEEEFIVRNNIGGIILFARNIESPEQISALTRKLQGLRHRMQDRAPLFISIDMEGGRVHRLKAPFTLWPSLAKLGATDSASLAFRFAYAMGVELKAVGINLDYAPCLDVLTNPTNTAIGDRALSSNQEQVAKLASAMVRGYIKSGVIPCGKHFPGHGNTRVDSHHELPVEEMTFEEIEAQQLEPFKRCFRAKLPMVMTSHILFPKIDPVWPGTLSQTILTDILRDKIRFRGVTITDDLGMKALSLHHTPGQIAVRALQAGANILMFCNDPESPGLAIAAIEEAVTEQKITLQLLTENANMVLDMKKEFLTAIDPIPDDELRYVIGNVDHKRLAEAIVTGQIPEDLLTQPK
jgi:beta-N-acetylhexosaminidase